MWARSSGCCGRRSSWPSLATTCATTCEPFSATSSAGTGSEVALVGLEEVRGHILERVPPARPTRVPLGDALGLALSEDVAATEPVPPFANSAMDGFAVRRADAETAGIEHPIRLKLV
ncbi:MAG: hypothetical protein HYU28_00575, partial [Actinobacteria bacterium]|nr:hypothetical protein [Actinomycetota bacterium]